MRLDRISLCIICLLILYILQAPVIIDYTQRFMYVWNMAVEYVVYFKDKEPYVFMFLPILFVYLLSRK